MENMTSNQVWRLVRPTEFLRSHDVDEFDIEPYQIDKVQRISEGERVWMVRNVDGLGRYYDLFDGKNRIVAGILKDSGEFGSGSYDLYVGDSASQAIVSDIMGNLRLSLEQTDMSTQDQDMHLLWMALELAEAYADQQTPFIDNN